MTSASLLLPPTTHSPFPPLHPLTPLSLATSLFLLHLPLPCHASISSFNQFLRHPLQLFPFILSLPPFLFNLSLFPILILRLPVHSLLRPFQPAAASPSRPSPRPIPSLPVPFISIYSTCRSLPPPSPHLHPSLSTSPAPHSTVLFSSSLKAVKERIKNGKYAFQPNKLGGEFRSDMNAVRGVF